MKNSNIRNLYNGKIITGVEINTTYNGEVIEILGYNFDLAIMRNLLSENVLTNEQKQLREFELIRDRFISIGVKMDIKNVVFDYNKETSRYAFWEEIRQYSENHKFFFNKKAITTRSGENVIILRSQKSKPNIFWIFVTKIIY